ncbi:murein hydrolase activator EnvC [Aestuariibius sp. HNIBRBA575]|uniref:murein hydrolase activator EnvC family protein n=1 Tax=Aestuariibius sp. HNIBRBA575 TaxID=3233343 RepID=UPI0034A28F47
MKHLIAAILILCAGGGFAQSSDTAATAQAAADRLEAASIALGQADGARDQVAALTLTVQAYEEGLASFREGLRRAAIRERTLSAELNAKSDEVARLLGVLQTMERAPAPLLLLHPTGPVGTARSGMMLSEVTPALQSQVEELRAQMQEIRELRALQDGAAETLQQGLQGAQSARTLLSNAISERTELPRRFTEDAVATALLIASTETLSAFASGLATTIDQDLNITAPNAREAKGQLSLPAPGQVLRRFNEPDAAGIVRPGIVVATRPRVLVTAPSAATLRYRGPLLDYGNVVILEPAPDLLFVIAGLQEVFGEAGQVLEQGAPIGLMGGETPAAQEILTESVSGAGASRSETLYIEVRDGDAPVDPADWFAPG